MDYDDVIELATMRALPEGWKLSHPELQAIIRAAAPILMEYGARLMREAAVRRTGVIGIYHLDPATIVREAVE